MTSVSGNAPSVQLNSAPHLSIVADYLLPDETDLFDVEIRPKNIHIIPKPEKLLEAIHTVRAVISSGVWGDLSAASFIEKARKRTYVFRPNIGNLTRFSFGEFPYRKEVILDLGKNEKLIANSESTEKAETDLKTLFEESHLEKSTTNEVPVDIIPFLRQKLEKLRKEQSVPGKEHVLLAKHFVQNPRLQFEAAAKELETLLCDKNFDTPKLSRAIHLLNELKKAAEEIKNIPTRSTTLPSPLPQNNPNTLT